ncbi:hypothetical protein Cni_G23424 [Canna indica]|uniref:Senescence regulator n=1 Tax=Canna indica TaxID=4628 RepID=A0AAQ3KTG5_9LILI|nr:hypothetical protein Cni_G23424 [Canna indica]
MEDFQEADILWPDFDRRREEDDIASDAGSAARLQASVTAPVRIPLTTTSRRPQGARSWTMGFAYGAAAVDDDVDGDDYGDDGKSHVIPPHVIVARRIADKMAFSVCVGNGRTLKGRDLSYVRNSILRMTGFLER